MSSTTANSTVLVTGANGAVGYAVVNHALKAGYRVLAAVRAQSKADSILTGPSIASLPAETKANLSFVVIPDLLDPHAYDEALKGADYAIHVASPVPGTVGDDADFDKLMIKPGVDGTMNMLEAAERSGSVKRVVVTSSVVAQLPWAEFNAPEIPKTYPETARTADPSGPYGSESEAYLASKTVALNTAERWLSEKKRNISVVHVHPSIVLGKIELARTVDEMLAGSSGKVLSQVLNKNPPPGLVSNTIWLQDVAEVHVRALDPNIPNGQSLVASSNTPDGSVWASGRDIVQKNFPKAIEKGLLPGWKDGWTNTKIWRMDVSETERLTGMKFQPFEKQVTEIVAHYLQMTGNEVA